MATTCQPQELMDNAAGFAAMPAGFYYPIKLALLCRWLKQLNPNADCSPQSLMTAGACFACLPPGFWAIVRLQLLCQILAGGIVPPPPVQVPPGTKEWTWQQQGAESLSANINDPGSAPCPSFGLRYRQLGNPDWIDGGQDVVANFIVVGVGSLPGTSWEGQIKWVGCAGGDSGWSPTYLIPMV